MENNLFVKYYNVFAEESSKFHLSVEELYLYGVLCMMKNVEQLTITNVDVIYQYSPVEFFSREKESKQRIRNYLFSLKQKEIIQFADDEIKNNTLLIISFASDLKDESVGKGVSGFERVKFVKFNSFPSMIDNYIYFTVKRFDGMGGFNSSYKRWADILNCADKTAIDKVDEAVEKGIIFKNIGDYVEEKVNGRNQKRQENNTYKTVPFIEEVKKEIIPEVKETEIIPDETETREHNWNVKGSKLDANDFYIYLTTDDDKLKKRAKNRINAISKNSKGEYMVNKLMDEAQELIDMDKRKVESELLKTATNAIRLNNGDIVPVDDSNIDNYTPNDVDRLYYASTSYYDGEEVTGELIGQFDVKAFQPLKQDTPPHVLEHENRPDMIANGFDKYKSLVRQGITLTYDLGNQLRNEVFSENKVEKPSNDTKVVYIGASSDKQQKEEEVDITSIDFSANLNVELMNEIMEREDKKESNKSGALDWINQQYDNKCNKDISEFIEDDDWGEEEPTVNIDDELEKLLS